jgi:hypothetical protein
VADPDLYCACTRAPLFLHTVKGKQRGPWKRWNSRCKRVTDGVLRRKLPQEDREKEYQESRLRSGKWIQPRNTASDLSSFPPALWSLICAAYDGTAPTSYCAVGYHLQAHAARKHARLSHFSFRLFAATPMCPALHPIFRSISGSSTIVRIFQVHYARRSDVVNSPRLRPIS